MSSGWVTRPLVEVCTLRNGRAYKKPELLDKGKFRVLRVGNFFTNNHWYYSDLELDDTKYCDKGDLLYAWSASFGPRIWAGEKVIYHYHIWRVDFDDQFIDKKFLFYWFLWDAESIKKDQGAGTTMIHVSMASMNARLIDVPPLAEQKRIVAILDEAFAGIDTAIANTEKNLANARELFESYLNSVFTKENEGWEDKTLKQVCIDFGRGKSKHRPRNDPKLYGGPYPFIQTGDVRNCEHLIKTSSQSYNEIGLAQSKLWPKGTICITIAANIAETGILDFDACFPDSIIGMVVDGNQTSNAYVEYLLQSVKARIKAKGKGSAQDNINLATFENEFFPFPDLNKQSEIVANLHELTSSIQRLEVIYQQKNIALNELKQALLQKAFSGELTAEDDQPKEEAVA